MKGLIRFASAVIAAALLPSCPLKAAVIGFDGILDGTPVAAGNPYGGVLTIDARAGWAEGVVSSEPMPDVLKWVPAAIYNERIDTALRENNPPYQVLYLMSEMTATFSEPVTEVTFDGWAWRPAGYDYFGENEAGQVFTGNGIIHTPLSDEMVHIDLSLPPDYFLTSFRVSNRDYGTGYDFWVDNIRFNVGATSSVPDSGSTVLLLTAAFLCLGFTQWRFRTGS